MNMKIREKNKSAFMYVLKVTAESLCDKPVVTYREKERERASKDERVWLWVVLCNKKK